MRHRAGVLGDCSSRPPKRIVTQTDRFVSYLPLKK
jgi:hypothetical protein